MVKVSLEILAETMAICRLAPNEEIPKSCVQQGLVSITRSPEELSIVCEEKFVPSSILSEVDWRCLRVKGALDFGQTGILSSLAQPLAEAQISIFALSTYNTDYLLIKQIQFSGALAVLERAGHTIERTSET